MRSRQRIRLALAAGTAALMLGCAGGLGDGNVSKVLQSKDIPTGAQHAAVVFDPMCKTLVAPFGITDNLQSLTGMGWEIMQLKLHSNFSGDATDQLGTIRKAGKTMNWLPMDAERLLGEHEHMELTGKILDAKREKNKPILQSKALLAELTKQIKEPTPYRFEIYVMRASNGNAQALPGGIIHIDLDLVKPVPIPDKAYFALAHELSHILQRHETRAVQARLTDSIDSVDGLRKIIATAQQQPDGLLVYTNDIMQRFVTFSENQELQADACAVRILHGVFQEPRRLTQVIRAFQDSLGPATSATMTPNQIDTWVQNVGKMGNLGDQHPNSQLREKNLQAMLALVASPGK